MMTTGNAQGVIIAGLTGAAKPTASRALSGTRPAEAVMTTAAQHSTLNITGHQ